MVPSRDAVRALGRDASIVDERIEAGALRLQPLAHLADGAQGVGGIGEVDLDVILGPHLPGAVLREASGASR